MIKLLQRLFRRRTLQCVRFESDNPYQAVQDAENHIRKLRLKVKFINETWEFYSYNYGDGGKMHKYYSVSVWYYPPL